MVAAGNMWWQTRNMVMRHFKTAGGADVGWKGLPMQTRHIINELPEDEMSQRASRGEWPMVITLSQLNQWDVAHGDSICAIYRHARLEAGDDVPQLASMALETLNSDDSSAADDIFTFPSNPSSLLWTSAKQNEILNVTTLEGARKGLSGVWNTFSFKKEFRSLVRSCAEGRIHEGITIRNCVYNETNMSSYLNATLWPCVLLEEDGGFSWCFMRHGQMMPVSSPSVWAWSLRDMLMVKNTPVPLVLVDPKSGTLVWQNSASMELIGCHGVDNVQAGPGKRSSKESHLNYLSILFHNEDELLEEMKMTVGAGNPWSGRMKVQSPELIRLIGARRGANIWYDISVSQARDPVDLVPLITILLIDVTAAVKAERRIKLLQEGWGGRIFFTGSRVV